MSQPGFLTTLFLVGCRVIFAYAPLTCVRVCVRRASYLILACLRSTVCHLVKHNRIRGSGVRGVLHFFREAAAGQEDAQHLQNNCHASHHDQQTLVQHHFIKVIKGIATGTADIAPNSPNSITRIPCGRS